LWDGEFRDTLGAQVSADGPVRHSMFVAQSGKRALVLVNPDGKRAIRVHADFPDAGRLVVATPEEPDAQATMNPLAIPARSAAVVMEI